MRRDLSEDGIDVALDDLGDLFPGSSTWARREKYVVVLEDDPNQLADVLEAYAAGRGEDEA